MIMVKKHAKPARKTSAASKGKSAARKTVRKPAAKKTTAKHGAAKRPAPAKKPSARSHASGKTARPAATKTKASSKPKAGAKPVAKALPVTKADKAHQKLDKVVHKHDKAMPVVADKANGKGAVAAAPAAKAPVGRKPSPGEIAARIAGKRAEDAAHKKGR